jgi:hypothetical protein
MSANGTDVHGAQLSCVAAGGKGWSADGTEHAVCHAMEVSMRYAFLAIALTGCIYTNVNTPLSYRAPTPNEVQGPLNLVARGEACNRAILGLVAWGDGGYAAAVADAKQRSGAHLLADVQADASFFNVLFVYSRACTRVTGFAVR